MAGKISDAEKNLKIGNKLRSITVKISSSKSIFSYQNGSTMNTESREGMSQEEMPGNGYAEEATLPEEPFSQDQNLKSECLDLLRKKLISELSLTVFSSDLENKLAKVEPIDISKERQSIVQKLLVQISQLSDAEKLLLYLKLPSSTNSPFDPLRQPLNPLGNRQEIQQTIVWIKTHLEEDSEISIPKQDVYDQYLKYCKNVSMKPLSTADFGKVMKQVYPGVRPRRLGTRGNSRYCYSGMRNTCKLPTPILPLSSTEFSTSSDSASNVLGSSSTVESTKCRKIEKQKRKWKSSCRSGQCNNFFLSSSATDKDTVCRSLKRTKIEETDNESTGFKDSDSKGNDLGKSQENFNTIKEETDLGIIKCEENSNNTTCAPDDCEADENFGVCFKNEEKVSVHSPARSELINFSPLEPKTEEKESDMQRINSDDKNLEQKRGFEQNRSCSEGNIFSVINGNQLGKTSSCKNLNKSKIMELDGSSNGVPDQRKFSKNKTRRSASFPKVPKNLRKNYVPIQPKPVESPPKLNFRFEQPPGMDHFSYDQKKGPESLALCEENDSQEPEEEIVRYFQHLEENEIITDLVDQAVKHMDTNTVQINNSMSQVVCNNSTNCRMGNDILNQGAQQGARSQSCFEVPRKLCNFGDNIDSVYVPRSQSSVELPVSNEPTRSEGLDSECEINGKSKKISHLRILLEKSISSRNQISYPNSKISSTVSFSPTVTNVQITSTVVQSAAQDTNCLYSQVKPMDRDVKIIQKDPSNILHSPNNRTKYFSFTPISPGPQSPLKTPITPSASPFVSPRDTPVSRPRQNSNCDMFLSPSEKRSFSFRPDSRIKNDCFNENVFTFSKTILGNVRTEENKDPAHLKTCRPRSFSSTNFCRAKAQRNSAKDIGYAQMNNAMLKNGLQIKPQNNFIINSPFSIRKNFGSNIEDSLSNEVQKFLENQSKFSDRSATIRSQSVPLNRMISESTWMPNQVSSAYSSGFNNGIPNPLFASVAGKFPEWMSNSDTDSPEKLAANISPFLANREVTNAETASFSNDQVFPSDPTVAQFSDQYFASSFQAGNEDGFSENDPFHEESGFSSKLDLHSSGTFDSGFTNESDPVIADNIKTYLPDFDNLESEDPKNGKIDKKLFKNSIYERSGDNLMDPVITSFKPVLPNELNSCPSSPVLNFFGAKINEDNQQLIELFDFEN